MKTTLLLVTAATCFLLPTVTQADPPVSKTKKTDKAATTAAKPAAKPAETNYIAKSVPTGSHIPTVWRSYNGRMDTPSNLRVYSQNDLNRSGQLDVASELNLTDPSISLGRPR